VSVVQTDSETPPYIILPIGSRKQPRKQSQKTRTQHPTQDHKPKIYPQTQWVLMYLYRLLKSLHRTLLPKRLNLQNSFRLFTSNNKSLYPSQGFTSLSIMSSALPNQSQNLSSLQTQQRTLPDRLHWAHEPQAPPPDRGKS
jgi:hypothetical protein